MGIRFGPVDPLQLIFEIINKLVVKGIISSNEADEIVKGSFDPNLSEKEKEEILNSLKSVPPKKEDKDGK